MANLESIEVKNTLVLQPLLYNNASPFLSHAKIARELFENNKLKRTP
ncbi:MAG: hypothetical protein AAJB65_00320 [Candidatus Hodgkinia cicadicola]